MFNTNNDGFDYKKELEKRKKSEILNSKFFKLLCNENPKDFGKLYNFIKDKNSDEIKEILNFILNKKSVQIINKNYI